MVLLHSFTSRRLTVGVHLLLLCAACFVVYSNNYVHDFHLDSNHIIQSNLSIRSLRNVPSFFVDPGHFSSLRSNVDYRPLLTTTYAVNFWMGGYEMWWWHFTQILIHVWCAVGLYFVAARVFGEQWPPTSQRVALNVAFFAALMFAVHPTGSGVVNYLSARSSALTGGLLLMSLLAYFSNDRSHGRPRLLSAFFFTLALFTKIEAVACLAVFFLYEALQNWKGGQSSHGFFGDLRAAFNWISLQRLWPHLAVTLLYFVVRWQVMQPFAYAELSRREAVGSYSYFITQGVAIWHYLYRWFVPLNLVADNPAFPAYKSVLDGPVLLAFGALIVVFSLLVSLWRSHAPLVFLAVSAYALISPTSSIVPLAEMVNEHRPFLPLALVSLCWLLPLGRFMGSQLKANRALLACAVLGVLAVLSSFSLATYQRNRVFATSRIFWKDVVEQAPAARAYMNYGLTFMREGDYERAEELFLKSAQRKPYWYFVHINLGILYQNTNRDALALDHYYKAVQFDQSGSLALAYRGEYYLNKSEYQRARADFEKAGQTSLERFRINKGLATAYAGLGDAEKSVSHTRACLALDRPRTVSSVLGITRPFWDSPERYRPGVEYYRTLTEDLPEAWWLYHNIGTLSGRLGKTEEAERAFAEAVRLKGVNPTG